MGTALLRDAEEAGFADLGASIPGLIVEARYAGRENFMGRPVAGYHANKAFLAKPAAEALQAVQAALAREGLGLKVFDAYRPQRAVDDFMAWCADAGDTVRKADYYPDVDKGQLVAKGYIAEKSGHSRGSTVDLTLVKDGVELDMGSGFDFFGPVSHYAAEGLTDAQKANRKLLRDVMARHGFEPYAPEWWHFTLRHEPYPDTYSDFPVR
ncbi:M15 family metallopeptidase [Kordiimonas marina]|uniref:M15 family metallopeptidase n=1 Tax=Kordiimonas marina TaxID=2872312 RepID=UPI001FF234B9|nr:M15 family metallopeptidase [Kordiimonas marina]